MDDELTLTGEEDKYGQNYKQRQQIREKLKNDFIEDVILTIESLNLSLHKAGGLPMRLERLKSMTAFELITHIAPNSIRFTYNKGN